MQLKRDWKARPAEVRWPPANEDKNKMPNWYVDWGHMSIFYGNEKVATFDVVVHNGVGYIKYFGLVEPRFFKKGLGGGALRALEQNMHRIGVKKVVLNEVLEEAEPFWKHMGYKWPEGASDEDEEWGSRMYKTLRKLVG